MQAGKRGVVLCVDNAKSSIDLRGKLRFLTTSASGTRKVFSSQIGGSTVKSETKHSCNYAVIRSITGNSAMFNRQICTSSKLYAPETIKENSNSYQLLVVGGGAGGCSIAAKYCRKLGRGKVAVLEPADTHYYQSMWTLVGAGVKTVAQSARPMDAVLPKDCTWIRDKAAKFDPENNTVTTATGRQIKYDYLVVATGIQLNYHLIKGLPDAFDKDKRLCSNYWRNTVEKTFPALQSFEKGNAIFTFPNTPIKCAGAPQKIMYLAEHYFRKNGKRDGADIIFNTSLGTIFGVKKYADILSEIIKDRNIKVNYKRNLVEVKPDTSEAVFAKLDSDSGETETYKYDFMHIVPPMSTPDAVRSSPLVDDTGYVNVHKTTLQHVVYPNVFGIGDCTNVPTSKTAAAVAAQGQALKRNLDALMAGKDPIELYNGYTSCPLVTGYGKCILAEFDFDAQPLETFPIDQGKERRSMYHLKKDVMPQIYWMMLLKGNWNGPGFVRKLAKLGMGK